MILTELNNRCLQSTLTADSDFLFEFESYSIVIEFSGNDNYDTYFNLKQDQEKFKEVLKSISKINSVLLLDFEYLGDRREIGTYSDPISISFKMFSILRIINKIDVSLTKKYKITTDFPDPLCATEPNYQFEIELKQNINSIIQLLNVLDETNFTYTPDKFYFNFYQRNKQIQDDSEIKILSTNTKARRLGYLKLINGFIFGEGKIPSSKINKKFEKFVATTQIKQQLLSYKNNKGEVKISKSGISAGPYIELAENLSLISKINNIYSPSKILKVYKSITDDSLNETNNPFELTFFDKLFFLERILNSDFLFSTILLEIIYIKKITSFNELKLHFHDAVINRINQHLSNLNLSNSNKRSILEVRNRISKWKKPEVYLEHVIMPRLNWFLDLGFIEISNESKEIKINKNGESLFKHICCWYDIRTDFILSPNDFTERFIQHVYASINNIEIVGELDVKVLKYKIDSFLDSSFHKFKTLAPNRTTLSQAVTYTKYSIFMTDKIPIEYRYIENYIKEETKEKYIYKYQHQYRDGYLQKK